MFCVVVLCVVWFMVICFCAILPAAGSLVGFLVRSACNVVWVVFDVWHILFCSGWFEFVVYIRFGSVLCC